MAWDQDEELLIAISDDGFIVHLEPVFTGEQLTDLRMAAIFPLLGPSGGALDKKLTDAEGLVGHNMDNGQRGRFLREHFVRGATTR